MKNINIIFLDIDGVLNSSITKEKFTGYIGIYLDMKLKKYGLHVSSKVNDYYPQRGSDIKRYLNLLEDKGYIPNFIIIDDELFNYYYLGYKHKLIKTSYYDGGLKKCHIKKALKIFKKG